MTCQEAQQGAGGVGGLLSVTEHDKQTPLVSYPCYDGNGNITEYLTEENGGALATHYEYDAFGNMTKKAGEKEYEYQFSTKPYDTLTGLNYYNYRDYDPVNGRWINRDPIEESGGINLYNFVLNDSLYKIDNLGLCVEGEVKDCSVINTQTALDDFDPDKLNKMETAARKLLLAAQNLGYITSMPTGGGEGLVISAIDVASSITDKRGDALDKEISSLFDYLRKYDLLRARYMRLPIHVKLRFKICECGFFKNKWKEKEEWIQTSRLSPDGASNNYRDQLKSVTKEAIQEAFKTKKCPQ